MKQQTVISPSAFKRLSRANKAILVAKDVLYRIKIGTLKPARNGYITIRSKTLDIGWYGNDQLKSAKECLLNDSLNCTVCARGGLFMSAIVFKNKLTISEARNSSFGYIDYEHDGNKGTKFLEDIFNLKQQALIECAFEESQIGDKLTKEEVMLCKAFAKKVKGIGRGPKAEIILTAICKNIIKNRGVFVP